MPRWIVHWVLCVLVFSPPSVFAQSRGQDDLEDALRDLPPAQRAEYRRQLLELDRVSRRLLRAIPNPPQVDVVLAAGEQSVNAGTTFGKIIVTPSSFRK